MYNKVTFPRLRWLSASFPSRTARVTVRAVDLEFDVDKVALGRVSVPVSYHSRNVSHSFNCHPVMGSGPLRGCSSTQTHSETIQTIKKVNLIPFTVLNTVIIIRVVCVAGRL